jgi:thiamine pyrophosphate-dependent acetolactate synthase large subunit-like protein
VPRMSGKRALMEQLVTDGVRHIFGNPGTTEQGFMDVLQDYPQLHFILALHEGVAVCMADAYARVTNRPAFVEVHIAPGLGNALGMIHNAQVGRTPLVVYAGQSETRALFQEPHLSGPLVEMARPLCKWAAQIEHAHDVPQALRRAFKVAAEPPRGPVFLALPMDTLDQEADVTIRPTSYTRWQSRPDPSAVAEAAELLLAAERPMLMVGDGVALSGAQREVLTLAELLGMPIFHTGASEFNVPANHPLNVGRVAPISYKPLKSFLSDCDLLLAVGASVFGFIFPAPDQRVLPESAGLIHVDVTGWEIGKNIPPDVGILADPKATLAEIAEEVRRRRTAAQAECAETRTQAISERAEQARKRYWDSTRATWDAVPISGARLMSEIKAALPPDAIVFAEALTNGLHLDMAFQVAEPGRYLRARGSGIGPGLPGTLGVQLAAPDRKVVGICSDGAAMYSITALWTAAHHDLPVTFVMLNNASYRILKQNLVEYLGPAARNRRFVEMDLINPPLRFDRMAESMGVRAWRVEDPAALASTLRAAIDHDGPSLVDVVIEGGVSMS